MERLIPPPWTYKEVPTNEIVNVVQFTDLCKKLFPQETLVLQPRTVHGPVKHLEADLVHRGGKYIIALTRLHPNDWQATISSADGKELHCARFKADAHIALEELALRFKKMFEV